MMALFCKNSKQLKKKLYGPLFMDTEPLKGNSLLLTSKSMAVKSNYPDKKFF